MKKVKFHNNIKDEKVPTGSCLILITPDSERTMYFSWNSWSNK